MTRGRMMIGTKYNAILSVLDKLLFRLMKEFLKVQIWIRE